MGFRAFEHRVMVVAPDDLIWAAVRTLLQSLQGVRVVCDVARTEAAALAWPAAAPDVAVSALRMGNDLTLPILRELRRRAPSLRILLLLDGREQDELAPYTSLGATSCLCWNDLTPEVLRRCLEIILAAPLELCSGCLREAALAGRPPARDAPERRDLRLDDRALAVLQGLAAGLTQEQVATATGMSPRTVQRTVAALQAELNVASLFALGCIAERLGLIPCSEPECATTAGGAGSPDR